MDMRKNFFVAICSLLMLSLGVARADDGMWLPSLIGQRIGDMQAKGFKLGAEDIYSVNQASLKDAVVLFGRVARAKSSPRTVFCSPIIIADIPRYRAIRVSNMTTSRMVSGR